MLSNVNSCLELSHGDLDLIVLANIQAKEKEDHVAVFCISTVRQLSLNLYGVSNSRFGTVVFYMWQSTSHGSKIQRFYWPSEE